MIEDMVWQQQPDLSYLCEASDKLVYKIQRLEAGDNFKAFVGERTVFHDDGINISWYRINIDYLSSTMRNVLKCCAADFARRSTKHIVKSITQTNEDGSIKYLTIEYS